MSFRRPFFACNMLARLLIIVVASVIFNLCAADIFTHPNQLRHASYDFIVVGGGTAGLVVANRLTEEDYTVLVLEAGGSHDSDLNITVPFFSARASPNTLYDWNYTTVPQAGLNNRVLTYRRGHLLGGSSSINVMAYTRGSRDDYDRYAEITGDAGWSWDSLLPYMFRAERVTPPTDGHDTTGEYDPAVHGHNGTNPDSLPGFKFNFNNMVLQATQELPDEFPFTVDYNGGNQIGVGWKMMTVFKGSRSSSATSYLGPEFVSRSNLDVLITARALRVLQDEESVQQQPHFTQVEYLIDGQSFTVTATKEIILSTGSIGTPTILIHSGIGDYQDLSSLGIPNILHLPSVGKNLTDHPLSSVTWRVNSTDTLEQYTLNATRMAEALEEWKANRTGVLGETVSNQLGFFRLPEIEDDEDPAAGPNTGHYELLFANGAGIGAMVTEGNYMSMTVAVLTPTSRGTVSVNSSNPLDPPHINPNFLTTELDRRINRGAIRGALKFAEAPVFQNYIIAPIFNLTTDEEIDNFIKQTGGTVDHPVSTAAMSAPDADYGVTNPDLKVKGAKGLRVVDASVLPRIPAAHTQAAVYIIAERAADIIKKEWRK